MIIFKMRPSKGGSSEFVNKRVAAEGSKAWTPTVIQLILLLSEAELFQPLLLRHGLIDEGAGLLLRLASSAADHTINSAVQDVEALLGKRRERRRDDRWG